MHTKEPWRVNDQTASGIMDNAVYICDEDGHNLARVYNDYGNQAANARRIVACVNACAGGGTDALEAAGTYPQAQIALNGYLAVKVQRDKLLAALNELEEAARQVQAGEMAVQSIDVDRRDARAIIEEIEATK